MRRSVDVATKDRHAVKLLLALSATSFAAVKVEMHMSTAPTTGQLRGWGTGMARAFGADAEVRRPPLQPGACPGGPGGQWPLAGATAY